MIHEFFLFLGTQTGLLLKKFIELIFFTIIAYMITSEFLREKTNELRYLLFAFFALVFQKMIMVVVLAFAIFGNLALTELNIFLPVLDHTLEVFALILLVNAFIYPYRKWPERITSSIIMEIIGLLILTSMIQVLWMYSIDHNPFAVFTNNPGYLVFTVLKALVLLYAVYFLMFTRKRLKYKNNVLIAFLVYAIVPLLQIVNWIVYNNRNARLEVALHPFPFISILLFTQIIYLKLADKATLKNKLAESEQKYLTEKEVSKMKDEFVSVVSHELRTPLTSMKLYTSLLQSNKFGKVNKKQNEALDVIRDETGRLTDLINDILTLSRFEAKHEKLNLVDCDLVDLIKDCSYYNLAEKKNIEIKKKIPPVFLVRVDIDKFKQVFINLLSNAIKFTEAGGKITITLKELADKWMMSIADTGFGIKESELGKLFDKFYQSQSHMTKTQRGTGLGLAIVKKIVDMHHGEIKVSSEIGKGSTFSVFIPKDL